ncbi:LacI family transcriptional regulator [Roseibium hamelinense]|nr:LacI family DNA-binding transcriptional regulator [Roseibium hamelinense]MTI45632.1 LacI family transcriptional regulator [Roseibium hamelinense]
MPTIKDVAKKASVSVGTVSRVLADNDTVKEDLRKRVLSAMRELNYKPNLAARALRTNSIDVVGLIVPDITNPFFAQLAKNIEMEAATRGQSVMLANSHDDPDTERTQVSALHDRAVSGIFVVAATDGSRPFTADIPIVSLDRRYGSYPLVATDQRDGSRKLAAHLHDLGHRKIAYIAGPEGMGVSRERRDGFVEQIEKLTSDDDPVELAIYHGDFSYDAGEAIGRLILESSPSERPTAIAAASDQQAIGVMRSARDLRINVPQDLSVTGFDDIALASLVVPRLTTLRQPIEDMASGAVERIFLPTEEQTDFAIRGSLVVRQSTAPPPSRD